MIPQPPDAAALAASLADWWRLAGVEADAPAPPARTASQPDAAPQTSAPAATVARAAGSRATAADAVAAARALAGAAHDLDALRAAIAGFDGCALKATATQAVFSAGVPGAPVMLVGEAPGREEDEAGAPFVGRSGQLLDRMLATIGLSRASNLYIANVVPWRPPGNRTPSPEEIAICLPFIRRQIALARPRALVFCGGVAAQAMLGGSDGIMKLRGRWTDWRSDDVPAPIPALSILHPAYLLRRPQDKARAWADLLSLEAKLTQLGIALTPPV